MTDKQNNQTALKPCPFCGGAAELEHGSDHHDTWFNLGCSRHWGNVDPDNACIGGRLFYTECEEAETEAITAWNTRAISERERALIEALRWFIDDIDGNHTVMVEFDANVARARAALAAYGDVK